MSTAVSPAVSSRPRTSIRRLACASGSEAATLRSSRLLATIEAAFVAVLRVAAQPVAVVPNGQGGRGLCGSRNARRSNRSCCDRATDSRNAVMNIATMMGIGRLSEVRSVGRKLARQRDREANRQRISSLQHSAPSTPCSRLSGNHTSPFISIRKWDFRRPLRFDGRRLSSRQEQAREAIEGSSQQGVWDKRQQGRREQQLQRIDKPDCHDLIDADRARSPAGMESSLPASPRGATADASAGALGSPTDSPASPPSHPECRRAGLTSSPSSAGRRTANLGDHPGAPEDFPNHGRSFRAQRS